MGLHYSERLNHTIELEAEEILGHKSAHSFEVGPVIAEPFISPLELTITPALSSKYTKQPSCLLKSFLYLIITPYNTKNNKYGIRKMLPFFLKIGLPFLTEQTIISPILAFGSLFYLALCS